MVKYTELGNATSITPSIELKPNTAPYDPRFPNQNQTRYCYTSFLDFHRCKKRHSEDYEACQYFKKVYNAMCPNAWIEKWNEQIENGVFPGNI
ncbi:cytochrome c oxidase subunit VIb polypeptide 1 [Apis mellifera caucasica]|uniref:Cytochrome c oxidase subunit n=1 Tax=Apis mellifera TaxID=7460 RepID=A0A7M6US06_APIME|nr:cytochrome c oxidase subunit VIb polypeptide 1 [Apis mellifera]KAG6801333.1 cytochrome c oxidase subunit VIb polypeptide 1 [Apis mellifera caucasica]KAG9431301.1 cytochrome c oxidase subunit VIb polypeptide 1 [Apis mellifera carnica]|eukprot:NP_001165874.1 cytochrome c oxidase subunit VIb polypeptide 1 [Apis mellifera]